MMFARAKYVAGRWPKRVGAHAQMGLPRLKLAQAMTRVMTTFLSARSQRLCCLDHCPRPCIRTLPNSKSRTLKVRDFGLGQAYRSPDSPKQLANCRRFSKCSKSMSIAYGGVRVAIQIHDEKVGIVIRINTSAWMIFEDTLKWFLTPKPSLRPTTPSAQIF